MIYWIYLLTVGIVFFDVALLMKNNLGFPLKGIRFYFLGLGGIFLLAIFLIFSSRSYDASPFFILTFGIPLYFGFRQKLFNSSGIDKTKRIVLWMSDSLKVLIVWIYSIIAVSFFSKIISGIFFKNDNGLMAMLMTTLVSSAVVLFFVVQASQNFSEKGVRENLNLVANGKSVFQLVAFPAFLGFLFASIIGYLAVVRPVNPQTPLIKELKESHSSGVILLFVLLALFLAPLVEEIVFRGYFFKVIKKIKNNLFAIVSVSMVFGLLHVSQYWGDWLAISAVFLLGLALTLLRAYTGSTIASIIAHFTYNLSVIIAPLIFLSILNPAYMQYQLQYDNLTLKQKERYLEESIEKQPFLADAYNDLAWIYYQEGKKLGEALEYVNVSLTYDEKNFAYLDTKMRILKKMGKKKEAIEILKKLKDIYFCKNR